METMQPPHTSGFFCSFDSLADGFRQARLCHLPRNVRERFSVPVYLCLLLRHTWIMSRIEK